MLNRILLTLMFSFSLSSALFISEIAEGTSNNKYIEIYNSSDQAVSLDDVSLSSCSNGCDVEGMRWSRNLHREGVRRHGLQWRGDHGPEITWRADC